jgi:toxin ParE1/3/4
MATLRVTETVFTRDLQRIDEHLRAHDAPHIEERLSSIFEALEILRRHPQIGRPVAGGRRELVIGQGVRGYVARYRYDRIDDVVDVLALRAQRERGFAGE